MYISSSNECNLQPNKLNTAIELYLVLLIFPCQEDSPDRNLPLKEALTEVSLVPLLEQEGNVLYHTFNFIQSPLY